MGGLSKILLYEYGMQHIFIKYQSIQKIQVNNHLAFVVADQYILVIVDRYILELVVPENSFDIT